MIPNIYIHEYLMLERRKLLQREAEQERRLSGLPHHRRLRYLMRCLGTLFVAIGTSMQQLEQPDQPAVCDGMQDGTFRMKGPLSKRSEMTVHTLLSLNGRAICLTCEKSDWHLS